MDIMGLTSWGTPDPQEAETNPYSLRTAPQLLAPAEPWPPKLAFDLALGIDTPELICDQYGLSENEFLAILNNPTFRKELAQHHKDLRENGITFKTKAKLQAEEYLGVLHEIIMSPDTAASVKTGAIKDIVKWAGYEPKESKETTNQPQFNIQINL